MMASGSRQTVVSCQQRGVQRFGQGYIDRVIRSDIGPQFPNPRQQKIVGVSLQAERSEVGDCHTSTRPVDLASCCIFANDLRHFDVKQVRRVQCLPRREHVALERICRGRTQEHLDHGRRVDDDQ